MSNVGHGMSWFEQINLRVAYQENLPRFRKRIAEVVLAVLCVSALLLYLQLGSRPPEVLLNIAFDAARPALTPLDKAWSEASGKRVSSVHAGSLHQTEALANGLLADTVCMSSPGELDYLSQPAVGLVDPNWRTHFPENSSPFTSTIVFVVRQTAQGDLEDWPDLFHAKRRIAVPDPRISGAGQYAYLALIYSAEQELGPDRLKIAEAFQNISFLPYAASRSTEVFRQGLQFDALLTWESEARRLMQDPANHEFIVVYPSYSLRIEAVVAIAGSQVDRRGTRQAAEDYLRFLFSPEGQGIIEQAGFRPRYRPPGAARNTPEIPLHSVEALFGSWQNARALHLGPNGSFSRLLEYRIARRGGTE